jgi:hypothetical protein
MAVMLLESLVRRGTPVLRDVVPGMARIGSNQANGTTPAFLSHPRYPSQGYRWFGDEPGLRRDPVEVIDVDAAADRAGRPGSLAGVLSRRSPAPGAGRANRKRWSAVTGGQGPAPAGRSGFFRARPPASAGPILPGRYHAFAVRPRLSTANGPDVCQGRRVRSMPALRTSTASTRGKRAAG